MSVPCWLAFFSYSTKSWPSTSLGGEFPSLTHFVPLSWLVHTSAFFSKWVSLAGQFASMSWSFPTFALPRKWVVLAGSLLLCPDLSCTLSSPVGECLSLARFLSMSWSAPISAISSEWVPLALFFLSVSWPLSFFLVQKVCAVLYLVFCVLIGPPFWDLKLVSVPWTLMCSFRCTRLILLLCIFRRLVFLSHIFFWSYFCLSVRYRKPYPNCGHLYPKYSHFFSSILVLPTYFQWRLSISNENAHHSMIGTFLSSESILSNIQVSHNYHPGIRMPYSCLIPEFDSCEDFK